MDYQTFFPKTHDLVLKQHDLGYPREGAVNLLMVSPGVTVALKRLFILLSTFSPLLLEAC
jgi:hypothetical protein